MVFDKSSVKYAMSLTDLKVTHFAHFQKKQHLLLLNSHKGFHLETNQMTSFCMSGTVISRF